MTSVVPKIVIKPRGPAPALAPPPSTESPSADRDSPEDEDDGDAENEDSQPMDVDDEGQGSNEEPTQAADEEDGDTEVISIPTPRPRGRPRGRGRGTASGASTPRARGRGRGRGRPRGRGSLLIRLPKRNDDDTDFDGEEGGSEDVDRGEGTPMEGDEVEKEAPLGGGKPFRKIQGGVYVIDGDEYVTEDDPKGDEKIDKFGNLLGGRRFKSATFILPNRHPQRQYMLAIDAARTSGFRDSLYYFRKNLLALKLNATQPEKEYLISEGKLGSHLRTRSVTLVTARSAFKLHGSKMIFEGKWVTDDYYEAKVLEEITARGLNAGDPVGDLPDPNATHHNNELSALNAASAAGTAKAERMGGGGGIYRAGGPTTIFAGTGWGPYSDGPLNAVRKSILSRDGVDENNWMWMMATRVAAASDEWAKLRREAVKVVEGVDGLVMGGALLPPNAIAHNQSFAEGEERHAGGDGATGAQPTTKKRKTVVDTSPAVGVYEPHSNLIQYRADTQPTSARWDVLPDTPAKRVIGGTKVGNGAWGLAWVDTVMEFPDDSMLAGSPEALKREKLLKEAEASGLQSIDFT